MPTFGVQNKTVQSRVSPHKGFTLVEMIATLMIVAILALVAVPRFFERQDFDARIFFDQLQAMLRYAQKIAIAQNRDVQVRLDGASIAFCFAAFGAGGSCSDPVPAPGGKNSGSTATLASCNNNGTWFCEAVPDGMSYAAAPAIQYFYFNALGKPFYPADTVPVSTFSTLDLTLTGGDSVRHVYVEAETGYVHP